MVSLNSLVFMMASAAVASTRAAALASGSSLPTERDTSWQLGPVLATVDDCYTQLPTTAMAREARSEVRDLNTIPKPWASICAIKNFVYENKRGKEEINPPHFQVPARDSLCCPRALPSRAWFYRYVWSVCEANSILFEHFIPKHGHEYVPPGGQRGWRLRPGGIQYEQLTLLEMFSADRQNFHVRIVLLPRKLKFKVQTVSVPLQLGNGFKLWFWRKTLAAKD
ncbi:hypothetical protein K438DRAFT_1779256 [Mycena galopus ATCC 62051]|nr:hypothetical protein K438DRAFT_1779256 [Mycena galopus ATCC 62051]